MPFVIANKLNENTRKCDEKKNLRQGARIKHPSPPHFHAKLVAKLIPRKIQHQLEALHHK